MAAGQGQRRRTASAVAASLAVLVAVSACSNPLGGPAAPDATPDPGESSPTSGATPDDAASPGSTGTASPETTPTPGDPLSPGGTVAPEGTGSPTVLASPGPSSITGSPADCSGQTPPALTPLRVQRVTPQARRTTEVVVVQSDGRTLTSGSREQSDFTAPSLTAPGGAPVTDPGLLQAAASLVGAAAKTTVLLERPAAPDADADPSQRPFSTAGTYVLYNASTVLVAEVVVRCASQEQGWTFTAEGNPTVGQVNCAVEPARSNGLARAVHQANC